jgi:hypothetical protein
MAEQNNQSIATEDPVELGMVSNLDIDQSFVPNAYEDKKLVNQPVQRKELPKRNRKPPDRFRAGHI